MGQKLTGQKTRVALITGASSGLGAEFVRQFFKGHSHSSAPLNFPLSFPINFDELWIIARRSELLDELQQELLRDLTKSQVHSPKILCIPIDLSDPQSALKISELLKLNSAEISWFICNAGIGVLGPFDESTLQLHNELLQINLLAPMNLLHTLSPYFIRGCRILPVASSAGFSPIPYFGVYAASKSFLIQLCLALSTEWKERGIQFTIVCPGPVKTDFFKEAELRNSKSGKISLPFFASTPKRVVSKAIRDGLTGRLFSFDQPWIFLLYLLSRITPVRITLWIMKGFKKSLMT